MPDETSRQQHEAEDRIGRDDSQERARWEGGIDAQTRESVRRLDAINGDLRTIKELLAELRSDSSQDRINAVSLREKADRTADLIASTRDQEFKAIKEQLEIATAKTRNTVLAVGVPLLTTIVGGLIVFLTK